MSQTNLSAFAPLPESPESAEPSATKIPVRQAVTDLLRAFGMTTMFGNPGSTELPMFLNFPDDFKYVLALQESIAVGMADGYAQATRNAAFVNLHSAAGVGHAMGNIFTAHKNHTPLVIVAGQQSRSLMRFEPFLFSNQATELPKPYVKWSIEPARAEDVPHAIARAYYMAMQPPRGPVLVSVPADDWSQLCDPVLPRVVSQEIRPAPDVLALIGDALDKAKRPVFVVGAAVDRDNAWNEVVELAERHNALVWAAPMSGRASFPENHRLFAGFLHPSREKIVAKLAGHDLVFALGAPVFTYHVEGKGRYVPEGTEVIQLIEDPNIAAWAAVGTCAVGSIRLGLVDLLARAAPRLREAPQGRKPPLRLEPSTPMTVAYLMQMIEELRDPAAVVVEEAPTSRYDVQDQIHITETGGFYTMCSGGLGYSMPAAMGVALARPDRRVIGIFGDGSSLYSIQALWNAAQLGLKVTVIILRNGGYAALRAFAPTFGFKPEDRMVGTEIPDIDFLLLAKAQGCEAVRVTEPSNLRETLIAALASDRPTLVEVTVAPYA